MHQPLCQHRSFGKIGEIILPSQLCMFHQFYALTGQYIGTLEHRALEDIYEEASRRGGGPGLACHLDLTDDEFLGVIRGLKIRTTFILRLYDANTVAASQSADPSQL